MTHLDYGRRLLDQMVEDLAEDGDLEVRSRMEGNSMHLIFAPKKTATKAPAKKETPASNPPSDGDNNA